MKKVIAWLLVLALTAAVSIGATLAYLTDTDEDVNVMTLGKVKIDQLEYERVDVSTKDEDATVQEFHDNKPLYPAVTDKEKFDWETDENYVNWDQIGKDGYTSGIWNPDEINNELDKMVFVKNKGDYDAYVRSVFAFEAGNCETLDAYLSMIHLNINESDWDWDWVTTPVTISGTKYFIATATYNKVLNPGEFTEISLGQIALDASATNEDVKAFGDTFQVLVKSQGIQAEGFEDPDIALNEGFGVVDDKNIPWENDSPIRGIDLKTALHYYEGKTANQITTKVKNVIFGLNKDYASIVDSHTGTLIDIEQDVPVYAYYVDNGSNYDVYVLANDKIFTPKDSSKLFNGMSVLESVNTAQMDTSRTENMLAMFQKCVKLKELDVSKWDVSSVKNMTGTFVNCNALEKLIGSENWDTSSVTNMYRMFDQCKKLKSFNGTGWNLEAVESTEYMFRNCAVMEELIGTGDWYMPVNTTMKGMFQQCETLKKVDVHNWEVPKVNYTWDMFLYCSSLEEVAGISNWDMGSVIYTISMFKYCYSLETLEDLSGWDMRNATDIGFMFASCTSLKELKGIGQWQFENLEKAGWTFEACYELTELDIGDWNMSKVQTFNNMFGSLNQNKGDMKLQKLDISKWDTSSATTMAAMFYGCGHLTELDLSGWNMPNLTTVSHMLADCYKLEVIDVSGWQTPSLTSLDAMFNNCEKVKLLDMSSFDTSNVREFSQVFEACYSLETILGLENWVTTSGHDFSELFSGCGKLKELNLSSFDTRNANAKYLNHGQYENWMFLRTFSGLSSLEKITFGPYFSFDGDGSAPESYKVNMSASTSVPGWDGNWYNAATGEAYAPSKIPEETAATYLAVKPGTSAPTPEVTE